MTDIPILFKPEMVRPILREVANPGTGKSQTRRILKPQFLPRVNPQFSQLEAHKEAHGLWRIYGSEPETELFSVKYAVGDRLWVREAWRTISALDLCKPSHLDAGHRCKVTYEADPENRHKLWHFGRLRASMHLPKIFSRITCPVTDVRVQRLQDISEEDAMAEGAMVKPFEAIETQNFDGSGDCYHHGHPFTDENKSWFPTAKDSFRDLWDSINGDGAWDANPWIVAVTFKPLLKNILEFGETE